MIIMKYDFFNNALKAFNESLPRIVDFYNIYEGRVGPHEGPYQVVEFDTGETLTRDDGVSYDTGGVSCVQLLAADGTVLAESGVIYKGGLGI